MLAVRQQGKPYGESLMCERMPREGQGMNAAALLDLELLLEEGRIQELAAYVLLYFEHSRRCH